MRTLLQPVSTPMHAHRRLDSVEYLDFDAAHGGKHEFWHGHIVAMAGASPAHNILMLNIAAVLHGAARRRGCQAFPSDQRVRLPEGHYVYPDLSVACNPQYDEARPASLLNPLLLIEIVSDTTADTDRRAKLGAYTALASVEAYWLFEQDTPYATIYERRGDVWTVRVLHGLDAVLTSPLFDTPFTFADLYAGVPLSEKTPPPGPLIR